MDASRQAQLVLAAYRTEYSIYGVVLVSAIIAVSWEDETDLDVLLFTLGSVVVFWLAHIYAGTVAREETEVADRPRYRAILEAALASARHTAGLLIAMVLPTIALLLAVVGVLDEYVAYYLALWVGVAVLAVLGWTASARRGSPWHWRLVSAIVTASLGVLVIWLGALFH
jgi:hypothetical protein